MARITTDVTDDGDGSKCLKTLFGITGTNKIKAVKGPRRTKDMEGCNSFTVHVLSASMDEDSKAYNGTLLINFYCPNYTSGNANVELMGPVTARVVELFDDTPLIIDGYNNFNLVVDEPLGPLFDPAFPNEHFMSVRIKFNIFKKGSV
jgi:hypothetical protein